MTQSVGFPLTGIAKHCQFDNNASFGRAGAYTVCMSTEDTGSLAGRPRDRVLAALHPPAKRKRHTKARITAPKVVEQIETEQPVVVAHPGIKAGGRRPTFRERIEAGLIELAEDKVSPPALRKIRLTALLEASRLDHERREQIQRRPSKVREAANKVERLPANALLGGRTEAASGDRQDGEDAGGILGTK